MLNHTLLFSISLLAVVGCEQTHKNPMDMKFSDTYVDRVAASTNPSSHPPVLEGKLPLVYLASMNCQARVMDVTNSKQLAVHEVRVGEYISVDSRKGIRIGNEFTRPSSLDPTGRYAIYLDR